jgi:hypothetical protein
LHIRVDVADKAAKVHVRTGSTDTDNVIRRADTTAGLTA